MSSNHDGSNNSYTCYSGSEQAQTFLIDRQNSRHNLNQYFQRQQSSDDAAIPKLSLLSTSPYMVGYGSRTSYSNNSNPYQNQQHSSNNNSSSNTSAGASPPVPALLIRPTGSSSSSRSINHQQSIRRMRSSSLPLGFMHQVLTEEGVMDEDHDDHIHKSQPKILNSDSSDNNNDNARPLPASSPATTSLLRSHSLEYGSFHKNPTPPKNLSSSWSQPIHTIRFQVLIWNIGSLDVVAGTIPMTFRISLFWNAIITPTLSTNTSNEDITAIQDDDLSQGANMSTTSSSGRQVWKMHGRQKALAQEIRELPNNTFGAMDVPPLAILNASTFHIVGSGPGIDMLNEDTKLMRWTCMYRATVIQDNLRVDNFPHDAHEIQLRLAILSHRSPGKTWDRRYWKLGLATAQDTQDSIRVPHGLMVDHVRIPGFRHNPQRGLEFQFCPLHHGSFESTPSAISSQDRNDVFLKVSLHVLRESGYYDNNMFPILALMNVVAISVLTFDDSEFFYQALITLNIAFVQMGMRMTTDNHLPNVEYQIRLHNILNGFFVVLMFLVLEAMAVYVMNTDHQVSGEVTKTIDWATGILAVLHNVRLTWAYYSSRKQGKERLMKGKDVNKHR